jgi:quercetin dioxygenase-like cupin family protein
MMDNNTPFHQTAKGTWLKVDPGVERMIMGYNNDLMMVKVKFEKDAVGALHFHPHLQSTYIAKGRFEVTIDGKTCLLGEGDGFFVESTLEHAVVCKEEGLLIDVFNPCREDFLYNISPRYSREA